MVKFYIAQFGVKDRIMEERYQQYFIASFYDRASPFFRVFFLPFFVALRLFLLVCWLLDPWKVTPFEYLIMIPRIIFLVAGVFIFYNKWDSSSKCKIGLYSLWLSRSMAALMVVQQAVIVEHSPQIMTGLVSYTLICGMSVPYFVEYLCFAVSLPYIYPIRLYLAGDYEQIPQILFQHTAILAFGLSINWTIHGNCRFEWLRFPAAITIHQSKEREPAGDACTMPPSTSGHSASPTSDSDATENLELDHSWDQLDDGYFTDADRDEMRADATRVRHSPRSGRSPPCITRLRARCHNRARAPTAPTGPPPQVTPAHPVAGARRARRTAGGGAGP
jgi:hypothetical protein